MNRETSQAGEDEGARTSKPAGGRARAFPRALRLLKRADFRRVFDDAQCRSADDCLLMLARPNGLDQPRLGLAISKRNIRTAVGRNRVKRLVRESFRHNRERLAGLDIVVLSRRDTQAAGNETLRHSLNRHWRRLAKRCASSSSS